jgi:hypothetical protein
MDELVLQAVDAARLNVGQKVYMLGTVIKVRRGWDYRTEVWYQHDRGTSSRTYKSGEKVVLEHQPHAQPDDERGR